MSDLIAALGSLERRKPTLDQVLRSLSSEERFALENAMADEAIPAPAISRVLAERGIHVSEKSIQTWRRRNLA